MRLTILLTRSYTSSFSWSVRLRGRLYLGLTFLPDHWIDTVLNAKFTFGCTIGSVLC